jgi:RNA polymerase sigma-70 factor (ECF subfamily)
MKAPTRYETRCLPAQDTMTASDSDEVLLVRTGQGDAEAFAVLYDRHAGRLLGLMLRRLTRRSEAEDVLQETFWRVWSRAHQFDPQRGAGIGWLLRIARSRVADYLRRRRVDADHTRGPAPSGGEASESFERGELSDRVRAALGNLPDPQRQAIALAFYRGWTHERIAREQNLPLGTVKTHIRRGVGRLREALAAEEKSKAV